MMKVGCASRSSRVPVGRGTRFRNSSKFLLALFFLVGSFLSGRIALAQETPYFVTYSHDLEEPGNLEIALKSGLAKPANGNRFFSSTMELEYGATAWWTTELYLSGVSAANDSTIFTGYRWENRFRPLAREHWINPVLYVEYEHINRADKSLLEVVGHDSVADLALSNAQGRSEREKSFEMKLILSSRFRGWNVSENFIAEKEINDEPWEFGYALGVSRPLGLVASSRRCVFCRENFALGAELYGGLGDGNGFGWRATSQYFGPTVAFNVPKGPTVTFSPNFGLNDNSLGVLYRFKVSYEVQQLFGVFRKSN
jgi:hypothetical protein